MFDVSDKCVRVCMINVNPRRSSVTLSTTTGGKWTSWVEDSDMCTTGWGGWSRDNEEVAAWAKVGNKQDVGQLQRINEYSWYLNRLTQSVGRIFMDSSTQVQAAKQQLLRRWSYHVTINATFYNPFKMYRKRVKRQQRGKHNESTVWKDK